MEAGFPDMSTVINIIFFLVVAIFLILAARMIMDNTQPKVVVSTFFFPVSYPAYMVSHIRGFCRKKGWSGLMTWIVTAVSCLAVCLLVYLAFKDRLAAGAGGLSGGIIDISPIV